MKKILIIHETLAGGGAERVLVDYLNIIDLNKYHINLVLVNTRNPLKHYLNAIPKEIPVLFVLHSSLQRKIWYWLNRLSLSSLFELLLLKKLNLENYDIIVSFMEGPAMRFHSHLLNHTERNITWTHIDFEKNHWSKRFFKSKTNENNIYNQMTDIIFQSESSMMSFNRTLCISDSVHQKVIYNIIDIKRILCASIEFKVKKEKFTVIGVGRLTEQKRFDRFIEVARILSEKGFKIDFWIFGEGHMENILKEKAKKMGLENQVFFRGFVSNPYPYIKSADIFLLTSDSESFPTVVSESLILGKPVVATEVAGIKEQLGDNEFGLVTKNMNPETIAYEIEQLYLNKDLLETYAAKALERASIYSTQETMSKLYQLFEKQDV